MTYHIPVGFSVEDLIKEASVHLSGTKTAMWLSALGVTMLVFACTHVNLHRAQTYGENLQSCSWGTLNECPLKIFMSPKARDMTLPEGSFSLVQANYFFKLLSDTFYDVCIFHDSETTQTHNIKNIHCIPS